MVKKEHFGTTKDGREISCYIVENDAISFRVMDYGAILLNVWAPDSKGKKEDIVLGFDTLDRYETQLDNYGATVGPVANRTAGASFTLDGQEYHMPVNEGVNNLHTSATLGLHHKVWDVLSGEDFVTFLCEVPDGECGLPGDRHFVVTYSLTVDNGIRIHYHMTSSKKTYVNPTNHTYFNLDGQGAGYIGDTVLELECSHYTPVREGSIPTGEIASVAGTPFDFTKAKQIGRDIDEDNAQLALTGGYDHNFLVDGYTGEGDLIHFATAYSEHSGRQMDVYTNLPGVQFYAGNGMNPTEGKKGVTYVRRGGFCLETQYYPDAIHEADWPQPVFGPETVYDSVTKYVFSVR
ncbi:MAG: aldose epimerase family protein [Lachnospiraceae bacterium]